MEFWKNFFFFILERLVEGKARRNLKSFLIPVIFLSVQSLSSSEVLISASLGAYVLALSLICMRVCTDIHSSASSVGILQLMACACVLSSYILNDNDNLKIFAVIVILW